ncbi:DNA cytosine methyltransferase [Streptomyces sp. CMB-StM0423]|uniref:DNA cytosine methyltransferase n=1 Tax=Streptomyces sp. CMB-StM0423 TaxID=2059884 RepID=UPI000C7110F4|nr:DNA (cytosine-5-)-methyltransferase [Streptomyces sp. CMB-StM0423]AUH41347.1 DNA (cytosine-5-)-methyltransferase [Streptomyces sp. CMB-StM0423]
MPEPDAENGLQVVEICAGAGGQSLGLHRAEFSHLLAVELDRSAADTLRANLPNGEKVVRVGDVADENVWNPKEFEGRVDLLAGGVPCPPFSIAGKQLGTKDERDLFAWAIQLCATVKPKALMLENVRGLSSNRFAAYRQHTLDRLRDIGYVPDWQLLHAKDFGVSQFRPRFVLVAVLEEYAPYFKWPEAQAHEPPTVGELLRDLMGSNGWESENLEAWVKRACGIAPTIVGGSKKHGGADLGPTRAKRAWAELGVDAMGIANEPPMAGWAPKGNAPGPKLTIDMVKRLQGWDNNKFSWDFKGRKTSVYRQIGNAFPPPVAMAVGEAIRSALMREGERGKLIETTDVVLDPVYKLLHSHGRPLTVEQMISKLAQRGIVMSQPTVERHLNHLSRDFELRTKERSSGAVAFSLGDFQGFIGQDDHRRHVLFAEQRSKIS